MPNISILAVTINSELMFQIDTITGSYRHAADNGCKCQASPQGQRTAGKLHDALRFNPLACNHGLASQPSRPPEP